MVEVKSGGKLFRERTGASGRDVSRRSLLAVSLRGSSSRF
jgi:hypothetical protein